MCYKTFLQLFYNNSVFVEGKEYNIPNPLKVYRLEFCSFFIYIYIYCHAHACITIFITIAF